MKTVPSTTSLSPCIVVLSTNLLPQRVVRRHQIVSYWVPLPAYQYHLCPRQSELHQKFLAVVPLRVVLAKVLAKVLAQAATASAPVKMSARRAW